MKVLVLSATGGTGRQIARHALFKGYAIKALVRSKARVPDDLPGAKSVEFYACGEAPLLRVLEDRDAIMRALGAVMSPPAGRAAFCRDRGVPLAMTRHGVQRLA